MAGLIKKYNIPDIGEILFLRSSSLSYESHYGKYFAASKKLGGHFCINCDSIEELEKKVKYHVEIYLKSEINRSEEILSKEKSKLSNLEQGLKNFRNLKNFDTFEVKSP